MILLLEISVFNKVLASIGREESYEDLRITNKSEIAARVIRCFILHSASLFRVEPISVLILFVKFSSNSSSLELQLSKSSTSLSSSEKSNVSEIFSDSGLLLVEQLGIFSTSYKLDDGSTNKINNFQFEKYK